MEQELHELLNFGAGVFAEDLEESRPDLAHVDVVLPRLLLQELNKGGERQGSALEIALAAALPVLSLGGGPIVAAYEASAFMGKVDTAGLECFVHSLLQEGPEAKAGAGTLFRMVMVLSALADLLLGVVDEAAAMAGVGDDGKPAASRYFVHKPSKVIIYIQISQT